MRVEAARIDLAIESHDVHATGRVQVTMSPSGTGHDAGTLFDQGAAVHGTAAELQYTSASRLAVLSADAAGQARVYQDENWVAAGRVEMAQDSGNLHATGDVVSSFVMTSNPVPPGGEAPAAPRGRGGAGEAAAAASTAPMPTKVTAGEMVYADADRKVVYRASPTALATLTGPSGVTIGRELDITLASAERSIQTLEAFKDVYATFGGGREAIGDRLTYSAAGETYVITGVPASPAYFKSVDAHATPPSCQRETSASITYSAKTQAVVEPGGPAGSVGVSVPMPCAQTLAAAIKAIK